MTTLVSLLLITSVYYAESFCLDIARELNLFGALQIILIKLWHHDWFHGSIVELWYYFLVGNNLVACYLFLLYKFKVSLLLNALLYDQMLRALPISGKLHSLHFNEQFLVILELCMIIIHVSFSQAYGQPMIQIVKVSPENSGLYCSAMVPFLLWRTPQ